MVRGKHSLSDTCIRLTAQKSLFLAFLSMIPLFQEVGVMLPLGRVVSALVVPCKPEFWGDSNAVF